MVSNQKLELKCSRCRLRLPIGRFSKAARKRDEPECFRCTAWAMSVEPDVVPPALESGHVSIEEIRGDAPDESGFGAEIRQLNRGIVESDLQDLDGESFLPNAMSVSDVPSSTLPPHLRAPANSIASSVSGSVSGSRAPSTSRAPTSTVFPLRAPSSRAPRAPSVVSYASRQLPPHLGGRAESVSTATTIRDARAQESVPFNAWDINGNRYNALRPPTTTDGMTSQSGRTGSVISGSTGTDTNFPKGDRVRYAAPFTPHVQTAKAKSQMNQAKIPKPCPSDDEAEVDYEDDDWN